MPPEPTPPLPLTAVLTIAPPPLVGTLVITFDKPLIVGPLDERAFTIFAQMFEWLGNVANVLPGDPTQAVVVTDRNDPAPPGDTVDYVAGPGGIVGQNGLPVATFIGFPVTVAP